jgi:hypothetical protein
VPSAIWIEWHSRGALFQLGFGSDESAAAVLCQAADFEDAGGVSSGRVDVQGGSGVHGIASLCGGRVRQVNNMFGFWSKHFVWF